MSIIKFNITFYSDWHCGSGLAAGADVDSLVVKDKYGLPFVPGKTIKGLVRESVEDYCFFSGKSVDEKIKEAFGFSDNKDNSLQGCLFFTNAELPPLERNEIISHNAQQFLYRKIASTKIDDSGIAEDNTLRKMEVVVPCTVEGKILDVPDEIKEIIISSFDMIKRLGQNRNRGLGRCRIDIAGKEDTK